MWKKYSSAMHTGTAVGSFGTFFVDYTVTLEAQSVVKRLKLSDGIYINLCYMH